MNTTAILFVLTDVIILLIATIWNMNYKLKLVKEDNKERQEVINGLWKENKELKEALFKRVAGTTIPEAKQAIEEATVTKEPEEVSEDIYNLTLEQWIYGAKEDKEGGIDG